MLTVAALGVVIGAGSGNLNSPAQTATANVPEATPTDAPEATATSVPEATPTDVPGSIDACVAGQLNGEITGWQGAAGHRIAVINLHNDGPNDCRLPELLRPALVDTDGHALIVGAPVSDTRTFTFQVGNAASTQVDTVNYCGAEPTAPLTIRFYLPDQTSIELSVKLDVPATLDPPPCNGPNVPASIEMQPLNP